MKRTHLSLLSAVAACLFTNPLWAAMPVPFGWYIEGDAGKSAVSNKIYSGKVTDTGFGWGLVGGYKFTQYVAGEVGFTRYAQTIMKGLGNNTFATDQHYSYDMSAKAMLPIATTGLNIFGKLGFGRINSYTQLTNPPVANAGNYYVNTGVHSHNAWYLGAGTEFGILPQLLVNVQWQRAKGTNLTGDLDLYSAGLSYIF